MDGYGLDDKDWYPQADSSQRQRGTIKRYQRGNTIFGSTSWQAAANAASDGQAKVVEQGNEKKTQGLGGAHASSLKMAQVEHRTT